MDIFKINQINKVTSKGVSSMYMNRGICISRSPALCLARGPGPKFVFIGPGPQFEFTGPDPKFVFPALAPNLYLPALALNLHLPALAPNKC